MTTIATYVVARFWIWAHNILALIRLAFDLIGGIGYSLADLGSRYCYTFAGHVAAQTLKAFVRGIFVFIAIGAFGGWQARKLTGALGPLVLPLIETNVLPLLLECIVPLVAALVVTARSGTALAAKFAFRPLESSDEDDSLSAAEIQREVLPHFIAVTLTAALFCAILFACLLIGFSPEGFSPSILVSFIQSAQLERSLLEGLLKAAACGATIAFVACALGIHAAEEYASAKGMSQKLRHVLWESNIIAIIFCSLIAFA